MSDYFDIARGHFLFRHTEKRYDTHLRMVGFGGQLEHDDDNIRFLDSLTQGPWAGWMMLETKDNIEYPRLWQQCAPSFFKEKPNPKAAPPAKPPAGGAPKQKGILRPALEWIEHNEFLKDVAANVPFNLKYPGNYPAILLADAGMEKQIDNAAPIWSGLICPSERGSIEYSSIVWPIDKDNNIDDESPAPISSAWYIYHRPGNNPLFGTSARATDQFHGLAWHTGLAGPNRLESVSGLGMCVEKHIGTTILFAAGRAVGGSFHPGNAADQHQIDLIPSPIPGAADIPINAQHVDTRMIWIRDDGTGDSPQEDSGEWQQRETVAPLLTKTYWRHDPEAPHRWALGGGDGLWKWQGTSYFGIIIKDPKKEEKKEEKPKPKPKPKPKGKPLPPDDRPPYDPRRRLIEHVFRGGEAGPSTLPVDAPRLRIPPDPSPPDPQRELFIPPELFGGERYNLSDIELSKSLALFGTPRELAFAAVVGRASLVCDHKPDMRNTPGTLQEHLYDVWVDFPAVIRKDFFAATLDGCEFDYTYQPGFGRYNVGGSASGCEVSMPPELSIEMAGQTIRENFSTTYQLLWETIWAIGTPHISSGTFSDGYKFELDKTSGTKLKLSHVSVIPATTAKKLLFGAGNIEADGNISCDEMSPTVLIHPSVSVTSSSATLTLEWGTVLVNYAGAVAISLPFTGALLTTPSELTITDISGSASSNNITISRQSTDVIGGGTSHVIGSDYGSVTLRRTPGRWIIISEFAS